MCQLDFDQGNLSSGLQDAPLGNNETALGGDAIMDDRDRLRLLQGSEGQLPVAETDESSKQFRQLLQGAGSQPTASGQQFMQNACQQLPAAQSLSQEFNQSHYPSAPQAPGHQPPTLPGAARLPNQPPPMPRPAQSMPSPAALEPAPAPPVPQFGMPPCILPTIDRHIGTAPAQEQPSSPYAAPGMPPQIVPFSNHVPNPQHNAPGLPPQLMPQFQDPGSGSPPQLVPTNIGGAGVPADHHHAPPVSSRSRRRGSGSGVQEQKLNSRFLASGTKYCSHCGEAVEGVDCKNCGRRLQQDQDRSGSVIFVCVAVTLLIFGGVYGASQYNWRQFFPDEKLAVETMKQAHIMYEKGEVEPAIKKAQAAVNCAPNNGKLHYEYSVLLDQEGRDTEAKEQAKIAATLSPDNGEIQESYAEMMDNETDDGAALVQYEKVIKTFPKDSQPYFWAGRACERLKKHDKAIYYYKEFIKRDPDNIDGSWCGIARSYDHSGRLKEAIAALREGAKKVPHSAPIRYKLGVLLEKSGDKQGAIRELQKSIELDWESADGTSALIAGIENKGNGVMTIPVKRKGNSYYVDVLLNGKVHAKLIVDSGAEVVALKPSVAEHLGLNMDEMEQVTIASATGEGYGAQTRLQSMQLGQSKEQRVMVEFHDMPDSLGCDGLLGMSFLGRYTFSLDGNNNILKLERKSRAAEGI